MAEIQVPGSTRPPGEAARAGQLVLALDTCGAESSLALAKLRGTDICPVREQTLPARTAGSMLTGALRALLGPAIPPCALHAVVVVRGPGSFTGMRIGLSAAKALGEACALPLVAVSRLGVLSAVSRSPHVALDAGRGRVYLGCFAGDDARERLLEAVACREALRHDAAERGSQEARTPLTVCEPRLASLFPEARIVPPPTALDAVRHAAARLSARDWDDTATLDALYLWRAEQMLAGANQPV